MRKRLFFWLLIVVFFLASCAERPLEPEIQKEGTLQEVKSTPNSPETNFYEQNKEPSGIEVGLADTGLGIKLIEYCWNEERSKCHLNLKNPKKILDGVSTSVADQGDEVKISLLSSYANAPLPTGIKVYYFEGEQPVEIPIKPNLAIDLPNVKRRTYFLVQLSYDQDVKGEAMYGFALIIK